MWKFSNFLKINRYPSPNKRVNGFARVYSQSPKFFAPLRTSFTRQPLYAIGFETSEIKRSGSLPKSVGRKRLKEIFDKYKEILDKFIENKKDFIEKVVNTRNYQTHHDKELKEYAAHGEDLYRLTQKLKMCLEIGFSSEEIKVLISKNNRYKQYFT